MILSGSGDKNFLLIRTMKLGPSLSHAELFLSVLWVIPAAVTEAVHSLSKIQRKDYDISTWFQLNKTDFFIKN